jgi:chromosome segregation ATPase
MDENLAEAAIRSLEETASRLISEQNNAPKNALTLPEKGNKNTSKKINTKAPSVIKSIGVGGSSIFSAEITRKPEPDTAPHVDLMKEENLPTKDDVKDDQWFTMYGNLVTQYENQFEANEKMRKEIIRRVERYNHNERDYRAEIKLLQRELRVRYGFEKDALQTNRGMFTKYQQEIGENIDNYENKVAQLEEEQLKEIARKYRSEVARTKKSIEEKRMKTGEDGDQLKEREAEIKHHLDLITNIAQRIDGENHVLRNKNSELKTQYKEQQIEREKLVKQLVLQKKENQKLQDGIKDFQVVLTKAETERDEEPVDLDKIAEENDIFSKKTQAKS